MTDDPETWTIEHFSQANPKGPGQDDVAALLRRVADTIDKLGDVDVQDVTFHSELSEDAESWPSLTVYLHRETPAASESDRLRPPRALRSVRTGG
jgi:hypothetical protein